MNHTSVAIIEKTVRVFHRLSRPAGLFLRDYTSTSPDTRKHPKAQLHFPARCTLHAACSVPCGESFEKIALHFVRLQEVNLIYESYISGQGRSKDGTTRILKLGAIYEGPPKLKYSSNCSTNLFLIFYTYSARMNQWHNVYKNNIFLLF